MEKAKEERWQYTDKRITIEGQTFDVTLAFPVPDETTETAADKIKHLICGEKVV